MLANLFTDFSTQRLEYLAGRIADCLSKLPPDLIWHRGSANGNSAGNLVLHLCGNVRQWIGSGVGGQPDIRERDQEFAAAGGLSPAELTALLRETVAMATAVIRDLDEAKLATQIHVQENDLSVLEAVYKVVEHFGQHTGQIIFLTKAATSEDLGFYRPPTTAK